MPQIESVASGALGRTLRASWRYRQRSKPRCALFLTCAVAVILVGLGLGTRTARPLMSSSSSAVLAGASATPVAAARPAASEVRISRGEGGGGLVASWVLPPRQPLVGEGLRIDRVDAVSDGQSAPAFLWGRAVRPGASAALLPSLPPTGTYTVTVTIAGPRGTQQLGPSAPFQPSAGDAPPGGRPSVGAAATALPCEGATYGIGAVSVDGWAGYQGSYCIPPAFSGGTGAFCIDHGLDYPFGAASYGWRSSLAGGSIDVLNQYDQAADPAFVARLNWIIATWGSTSDPARATAIGVIAHAVMGDYPGLTIGQLAPPTFSVTGGDPGAIAADTAQMWVSSATSAAPYHLAVSLVPGPYLVGQESTGTVTLTGQGGGPVADVPIDFSHSSGVSVIGDQPVRTGSDGRIGFHFTPLATSLRISASTSGSLAGPQLTVWTPTGAGVATQRVVTRGPAVAATGSLALTANALGQATLVKTTASGGAVRVGSGFRFALQREAAGGAWTSVAVRSTAANGTMASITGLASGEYRAVEQATPPAFLPGGPWLFSLRAGERATWTVTDSARPVPLQVVKTGDNPTAQPIGAGVRFVMTPVGSTVAVGTLVTRADGQTSPILVPPGRYLLTEVVPPPGYQAAPPMVVEVAPAVTTHPAAITLHVQDRAIRGTISLRKTDARTGAPVAGADFRITADGPSSKSRTVGTWKSTLVPLVIGSLLPGTYTVTEASPPPGYLSSPSPSERITVQPGEMVAVTFADRTIPAAPATTTPATTTPATTAPATTARGSTPHRSTTALLVAPASTTSLRAAAPASTPASAGTGTLAFTGSSSVRLVGWAMVALGAGIGLVGLARVWRYS